MARKSTKNKVRSTAIKGAAKSGEKGMGGKRLSAERVSAKKTPVKDSGSKTKPAAKKPAASKRKKSANVLSGSAAEALTGARMKTQVTIVQDQTAHKFTLLEQALERSGFWTSLDQARRRTAELDPENFRIIIKPDLALFDEGASTGTDPQLVERLIDLLHQRGYTNVAVGDGRNSFDLWLENRDVMVLAEMIGYGFRTEQGNDYEVIDLSEDIVEVAYPKGSALSGTGLARPWVEAHYRICFPKNKTDEEYFYALGLHNLLGVLPLRDKDYHYRHRLKPGDVGVDLLRQTPVDFSIIDAYVSNHGNAGSRIARPLETHTIIASKDLLLADWAATIKMGIDPYASPLNSKALREIGLPVAYEIVGDQSPYEDWLNVHPLLADSARRRNEWVGLSRMIKPWLQPVNQELFPFKDVVNERANSLVSRYLSGFDDNSASFWIMVGLNYWFGAVHQSIEALKTLYQKDRLRWVEAPLNIELSDHQLSDYEEIVTYLEPLAELISQVPADRDGLRWRYLDRSVLFEFSRVIPAPYEEFIARVDISRAIEFMNDYIGGVAVPVDHDAMGRVTHQAERNLYLTQPNYLVLYEGKVIDVTKLEYIRYTEGEQKIFWKSIRSENSSATFDDGIVTFTKTAAGETLVTVFGRQQFTLPLFWQAVNLDLNPLIKDFLVAHAYTTFFTRTLANFEAKFEGRQIRIGLPWNHLENEPDTEIGKTPTDRLVEVVEKLNRAGEVINQQLKGVLNKGPWKSQPKAAAAGEVDEDGFTHFKAPATSANEQESKGPQTARPDVKGMLKKTSAGARSFLNDLGHALQKDSGTYREDD